MLKTFILNSREEKILKDTQGTISFNITDENNDTRVVTGTTFLDKDGVAQGISSESKRELPLIEGLFRLKVKESIEIEFDYFNEVFDRDTNKTVNQIAYETVKEMDKEKSLLYRLTKLFKSDAKEQLTNT